MTLFSGPKCATEASFVAINANKRENIVVLHYNVYIIDIINLRNYRFKFCSIRKNSV